jgi:hypothetical protein
VTTSDATPSGDDVLRAAGFAITDAGKARFRRRLQKTPAHWTPELRAELRRQLGLREKPA